METEKINCENCSQRHLCPILSASEQFRQSHCPVFIDPHPLSGQRMQIPGISLIITHNNTLTDFVNGHLN